MKTLFYLLFWVFKESISHPFSIKNSRELKCIKCSNFMMNEFIYDSNTDTIFYGKCKKFLIENPTTNEVDYKYSSICRKDDELCGKNGKYYKENMDSHS
jgi:hypothetical protein